MRLFHKVAVITGAASGMGRACAFMFTKEGCCLAAADINDLGGEETVKTINSSGGDAIFVHTDVSQASDVENLVRKTVEKFHKIDILLNVAAKPQRPAPIEDIDDSLWDSVYAVNVRGIFHTMKYTIPIMKKARSGVIINVAAGGGVRPAVPNSSAYSSSKGAVINLTKAVSMELAPYHIRVNGINPGATDTPMFPQFFPQNTPMEDIKRAAETHAPLGRSLRPEEIAYAAVYLASDEAEMLSGSFIDVNGGVI
jgi:3-oxoacyl-[acyl-carrier protein] reductase